MWLALALCVPQTSAWAKRSSKHARPSSQAHRTRGKHASGKASHKPKRSKKASHTRKPSHAQRSSHAAVVSSSSGAVRIKGRTVMRFCSDRRLSGAKHAMMVQKQLDAALARHLSPRQLGVKVGRGRSVVVWAGRAIATVDPVQAKSQHMQVKQLAFSWVRSIRAALAQGYLTLDPGSLRLPVGSTRKIHVGGIATGPLGLDYDSDALKVAADTAGHTLTVTSLAAGSFKVALHRQGNHLSLPVVAREYAGSFPSQVDATVTGSPVGRDTLEQAALQAARRVIVARPGAAISLRSALTVPTTLAPGAEARVRLPLKIDGGAYYAYENDLEVRIRNEAIGLKPPTRLLVSNRPEKIEESGILYRGSFKPDDIVRLLYSHVNATSKKQMLLVTLANRAPHDARLLVLQADGGPAKEELFVGHRCNTRYLGSLQRSEGLVVGIPSMKAWELGRYVLDPQELASGLCHLQMLEGDQLEVTVETCPQSSFPARVDKVIAAPFNPFLIHPRGSFDHPTIELTPHWVAGEHETEEVVFGQAPWLIDPTTSEPNTGNYGVLYDIALELSNPTAQPRKVRLAFEPMSGVALGSFLVDGKVVETPCLKVGQRAALGTFELDPGQVRKVRIQTLPQAGSHYPARIVVTP